MGRPLDPIRRHPVVAFVALAWALAWVCWIPMALRGEIVTPGGNGVRFRGRRSGRPLLTPVECVREAGVVFVLVGHAEQKQSWRKVRAEPTVTVAVEGRDVPGPAIVHMAGSVEADEDMQTYLRHRPRVARILSSHPSVGGGSREAQGEGIAWVRAELMPAGAAWPGVAARQGRSA